jgi:hypothetical protein
MNPASFDTPKRKNDYRQHLLLQLAGRIYNAVLTPVFYVAVIGAVIMLSYLLMSLVMGVLFGAN